MRSRRRASSRNSDSASIWSLSESPAVLDVEVVQNRDQQLDRGQRRVEDDGGRRLVVDLAEEGSSQRRLAGSDLAGDHDEAAALSPAELQVGA